MDFKKLARLLSGYRLLETKSSKINGTLKVIREFNQIHVQAGGLTQSGDLVKQVWAKIISRLPGQKKLKAPQILVLGLGSGTLASLLALKFPESRITGVEIDPEMINIGKTHLNLGKIPNLEIVIKDAYDYCLITSSSTVKFDYIFVDLYCGGTVPEKLDSQKFYASVLALLKPSGYLFINRLFYNLETREFAGRTIKTLEGCTSSPITLTRTLTNLIISLSKT